MIFSRNAITAPSADLLPQWHRSNEHNATFIDHSRWQRLLNKYLVVSDQHHLFRYNAVTAQDQQVLKIYLATLSKIDPRQYRQKEQLAYWVNLYNALTVNLILENYPISSIKRIGGIFSFGPWNNPIITVADQSLSLNDIEHRILRPIWQDPRIHYVVNCASLSCPNLPKTALSGLNAEFILEESAKAFISSPKGVTRQGNTLVLSSIYDWYADDFGGSESKVLEHISQYNRAGYLKNWQGDIDYRYDWDLNEH